MTKIVNMSKVVPQLIQEKHSCLYHKTPKLQQVGIRGEKNYTFNKCNLHLEINMDKILNPSVTRFVIPELCTFFHNLAYIIIWGKQVNSLKKIMGVSLFFSLCFSLSQDRICSLFDLQFNQMLHINTWSHQPLFYHSSLAA